MNVSYLHDKQGYFNSIKVRLEHSEYKTNYDKYKFQFHKGAIRTDAQNGKLSHYTNFNSIKVRLELKYLIPRSCKIQTFQFHKGAIRTKSVSMILS